jgi:hypothetical protein
MTDLLHKDVIPSNPIDAAAMEVERLDACSLMEQHYPFLRSKLEFMLRRVKETMDALDEKAIDHIKVTGRDIEYAVDDKGNKMRLYLAHPKTTKCRDVRATIQALIQYSSGDWDAVESCLSSSAIKHGAAKKILPPETWGNCFTVEVKDKLESGEVAPKQLQKFDERFNKAS